MTSEHSGRMSMGFTEIDTKDKSNRCKGSIVWSLMNNRGSTTLVMVLGLAVLLFTMYTADAYRTASYIGEVSGTLFWCDRPGSLYPWPEEPDLRNYIKVLYPVGETDTFVYTYLIRSGILMAVTILVSLGCSAYISLVVTKAIRELPHRSSED